MNKLGHGRLRRITAEFRGDEVVEIDILEVSLRMGEVARTQMESDTRLVRLALKALDKVIAECCRETGARYPSYKMLSRYLEAHPGDAAAGDSNVVNLPT
ncbi:MAG TPA: hypothetical protein VLT92_10095 [Burkholderiales bacterium]|nr:hypothetical protein [Burkholderiales bacterium]